MSDQRDLFQEELDAVTPSERFWHNCKRAEDIVASWPEWKQRYGKAMFANLANNDTPREDLRINKSEE